MGRMKDLTIDSSTEDLEFLAEMQAHAVSLPCTRTSHEQTAYLLMQDGKILARGEIGATITSAAISETFRFPLQVSYQDGRFSAIAS